MSNNQLARNLVISEDRIEKIFNAIMAYKTFKNNQHKDIFNADNKIAIECDAIDELNEQISDASYEYFETKDK